MTNKGFRALGDSLLQHVRDLVRSGELTKRGLAKLTGYSQPHVHNVLAGVRRVNMAFADDVMECLDLTIEQLLSGDVAESTNQSYVPICSGELSASRAFPTQSSQHGVLVVPQTELESSDGMVAMRVGAGEDSMWPRVCPGDLIVVDTRPQVRMAPDVDSICVLAVAVRGQLRRCQRAGSRLLAVAEHTATGAEAAEWIGLERTHILDVVRGRVVWLSRNVVRESL